MDFQPLQDTVLCEKIVDNVVKVETKTFVYEKECVPEYKIVKLGNTLKNKNLKIGDIITTDSIPTQVSDGEKTYYIITEKYICGSIL